MPIRPNKPYNPCPTGHSPCPGTNPSDKKCCKTNNLSPSIEYRTCFTY